MLMAQSFVWLSPSSVITTSIGFGLMITSQIEGERQLAALFSIAPWPLSGVPHTTTRRELRHLWANQWKAFLRGCKIMAGATVSLILRLQANGKTPWPLQANGMTPWPLQANEIWFLTNRRRAEHKASRNWQDVVKKIQHGESAGMPIGSLCEFLFKFCFWWNQRRVHKEDKPYWICWEEAAKITALWFLADAISCQSI